MKRDFYFVKLRVLALNIIEKNIIFRMKILKNVNIHFIGVGGASMSALAVLSKRCGAVVSGSDKNQSDVLEKLESEGVYAYCGKNLSAVEKADLVVYSSAIKEDDEELSFARSRGITVLDRAEFLGKIADEFVTVVAVGGTHGKTTVTAMIADVLKKSNMNFVGHVGGETEYGNLVLGGEFENADFAKFVEFEKGGIFLTEACEYKKNVLRLNADIGVVLNAECDHPDCYPDIASVEKVFSEFLKNSKVAILPYSLMQICPYANMRDYSYEDEEKERAVVRVFSNGDIDVFAYENSRGKQGEICIYKNGVKIAECALPDEMPSTPKSVLFTFAVADLLSVSAEEIKKAVESFSGVKRRNEYAGTLNGARVIFDYAHHPSQIANVLYAHPSALVVFQPHTYSRNAKFMEEFASVLSTARIVVLMQTYGARESAIGGADSAELKRRILSKNAETEVYLADSHDETLEFVKSISNRFEEILMLGAGDIYSLKKKIPFDDNPPHPFR